MSKKTTMIYLDSLSISDIAEKLIKLILQNKTRMFIMFTKWIKEWGYFNESIEFIENIVNIFMTAPLFIQMIDNRIIFMETRDKEYFVSIFDIINEYQYNETEKFLILEYVTKSKISNYYSTRIEFQKVYIKDDGKDIEIEKIRSSLCKWFILFFFGKIIKPDYDIITVENICNIYLKSLINIKLKHKFYFIDKIISSIKHSIQ